MASTLSSTDTDFENFGHKVYLTASQNNNNQNVFLSPSSIALAMAMYATGARSETLNRMLRVLDASSIDQLAKTAEQIMHIFSTVDNDIQVKLKLASRLYGQKAYELREDYLSFVQSSFKADIKLEDFGNDSGGVVKTINGWVEEQTNKQFKEHLTDQNADFHETNEIAHLPYQSDKHSVRFVFSVILPKQGISLDIVEQKLASIPDLMRRVLNDEDTTRKELLLYLPKFKMEAKFELNDVLIQVGMINAFNGSKADFTGGMVSEQDDRSRLYISKVIHKAFVNVNELGSEAAAATAVIMTRCCAFIVQEEQPIEFKADRPFLFFIRKTRQNIVLFSGKFASPPTVS